MSSGSISQDRAALQQLVAAMAQSKDKLPEHVKALLETHQMQETEEEAKVLHKAVTAQQKARKELAKIRAARANYLAGWSTYLGQIQSMLQQQLEDQQKVLSTLDAGELQWTSNLAAASSSLKAKVGGSADLEAMGIDEEAIAEAEAEAADAKVDSQLNLEQELQKQREMHQASAKSLLEVVTTAHAKAASDAATAEQDRERTPRKRAHTEEVVVSDDDQAKTPAPHPGKARG